MVAVRCTHTRVLDPQEEEYYHVGRSDMRGPKGPEVCNFQADVGPGDETLEREAETWQVPQTTCQGRQVGVDVGNPLQRSAEEGAHLLFGGSGYHGRGIVSDS